MKARARALMYLVDGRTGAPLRKMYTTARITKAGKILAGNGNYYDATTGVLISTFHPTVGPQNLLAKVVDVDGKVLHDFTSRPAVADCIAMFNRRLTPRAAAVK